VSSRREGEILDIIRNIVRGFVKSEIFEVTTTVEEWKKARSLMLRSRYIDEEKFDLTRMSE